MIALVYWYPSVENLNKDSNWKLVWNMINEVKDENISWLVNKPSHFDEIGKEYQKDNVMFYETEHPLGRLNSVFLGRWEFLDRIMRKYPVDIVWNNLIEVADVVAFTFNTNIDRVPIVSQHHYVMHPSLGRVMYSKETLLRQVLGSMVSDVNIFHSGHAFNMFREGVEGGGIDVTMDGAYIPLLVFSEEYKNLLKSAKVKKEGIPKLIYNHRLENYKNFNSTFEKLDKIYKAGHEFKMYVTYGSDRQSLVDSYEWAETVELPKWSDYIELLANCDLGVLESRHETFCISAVEAMGAGVKMFMPRAVTFEEIADDRAELFVDDWTEDFIQALKDIEEIRKEKTDSEYLDKFGSAISREFSEMLAGQVNENTELPEKEDLRDYLRKNIKDGFFDKQYKEFMDYSGMGLQACPPFAFSKWLRALGYTVVIDRGNFMIKKYEMQ